MKRQVYLHEITLTDLYLQYRLSNETFESRLSVPCIYILYRPSCKLKIVPSVELTDFAHVVTLPEFSPVVGVQQSETEISRAATRKREQVRE